MNLRNFYPFIQLLWIVFLTPQIKDTKKLGVKKALARCDILQSKFTRATVLSLLLNKTNLTIFFANKKYQFLVVLSFCL